MRVEAELYYEGPVVLANDTDAPATVRREAITVIGEIPGGEVWIDALLVGTVIDVSSSGRLIGTYGDPGGGEYIGDRVTVRCLLHFNETPGRVRTLRDVSEFLGVVGKDGVDELAAGTTVKVDGVEVCKECKSVPHLGTCSHSVMHGGGLCGRLMVGSGTDTYDPTCELDDGHTGPCKSSAAIDQHRLI